jgi:hypothetical protein
MYAKYLTLDYDSKELLELANKNFQPWRKFKNVLGEERDYWEQPVNPSLPIIKRISDQLGNVTIRNCFFNKIPVGFRLPPHADVIRNTAVIIPLTDDHEPIYFWDGDSEDAKRVAVFEYTQPLLVNVKQPHSVPVPKHNDRISLQFTIEEMFEDVCL